MRVARYYFKLVPGSLLWLWVAAGLTHAAETSPPLNANEQAFLVRAMRDNASQIAMAELALAKSANPRVIELANAIIQQRVELSARMARLLPAGNLPAQQREHSPALKESLPTLDGSAFDNIFTSTAVRSHCRMIAAYQVMKLDSTNPALKDFTHDAIHDLRRNLAVAMTVLRSSAWLDLPQKRMPSAEVQGGLKAPVFWEPVSLVTAPW